MVLDAIVIVVVLISAVLAMVRGLVREVLSIASWAVAAAAGYFFYKPLVPLVQPYVEKQIVAVIISVAVIFFVALIVASYITMKISDFVIDSRVGAIDRALGFVFGAVRGLLLLVITFIFFNWLVHPEPPWVASARSEPMLMALGDRLMDAIPKDLMNKLHGIAPEEGAGGEATPPEGVEPPADSPDAAAGPPSDQTYANGQRKGLDQFIENSDGSKSPPAQ
jgi:membrane protein required for colicin V production